MFNFLIYILDDVTPEHITKHIVYFIRLLICIRNIPKLYTYKTINLQIGTRKFSFFMNIVKSQFICTYNCFSKYNYNIMIML